MLWLLLSGIATDLHHTVPPGGGRIRIMLSVSIGGGQRDGDGLGDASNLRKTETDTLIQIFLAIC